MKEFRIYLAYRDVEGRKNQQATADVVDFFNESNRSEKPLKISPSMVSRIRSGEPVKGEKRKKLLAATRSYLEAKGIKTVQTQDLTEFLDQLSKQPDVEAMLREYNQKKSKRSKIIRSLTPAPSEFNAETLHRLHGVWRQINWTCVEGGVPQIRVALKYFYSVDGRLLTYGFGQSTRWNGTVEEINANLHITEKFDGERWGEVGHYVYNRDSLTREPLTLIGMVQIVSHYQFKHMFSGVTILCKSPDLTKAYLDNVEKFKAETQQLKRQYCGYVKEINLDNGPLGIPNLREIVDKYLIEGGARRYLIVKQ